MHYEILDKKRLAVLPLLKSFKKDFYLAGGTGLALQLGHRDSIDFDFFRADGFDTKKLIAKIRSVFAGYAIRLVQEEKDTVTIYIDRTIKISFFAYRYPLIVKPINEECLRIASFADIACMKLSAVVGRSENKDYIDLYFILQTTPLAELLAALKKKMPELDENLVLKSLVYFEDVANEPIKFKNGQAVNFKDVKAFFVKTVKNLNIQ